MKENKFRSWFEEKGEVSLPQYSGVRVMMLPIVLGVMESIPKSIENWKGNLSNLFSICGNKGKVGYITIDEKTVKAGEAHRRGGLHVDGVYRNGPGGWGGGLWGSSGMLTVSNVEGCRAWSQEFKGSPGSEGECDHLSEQLGEPILFKKNTVYWCDGLCVHESIPMIKDTQRQFVRLSMPSSAPWFEGYTENPLGVKPTGPILAKRAFMEVV